MKHTSPQICILIVEDHLIARVGITTIINEQSDMTVIGEATSGQEAIELYRELRPDIVLMDLRLQPDMSGIETAAIICQEYSGARIIALTTYDSDADIKRSLQAGVRAYLVKDVLHEELIKAIRFVYAGGRYLPPNIAARVAEYLSQIELSKRELEVLTLIVKGKSNKRIAFALNIAEHTVNNHVKSILSKLGVASRTQAATTALTRGLISLD